MCLSSVDLGLQIKTSPLREAEQRRPAIVANRPQLIPRNLTKLAWIPT